MKVDARLVQYVAILSILCGAGLIIFAYFNRSNQIVGLSMLLGGIYVFSFARQKQRAADNLSSAGTGAIVISAILSISLFGGISALFVSQAIGLSVPFLLYFVAITSVLIVFSLAFWRSRWRK